MALLTSDPVYGNTLTLPLSLGRVGFASDSQRDMVPVNQDRLLTTLGEFMTTINKLTYNPDIGYYQERINGLNNYTTINIIDQLRTCKIVAFDNEAGELTIDCGETEFENLSAVKDHLFPKIRCIGSIRKSSTGISYYEIDQVYCVDIVYLEDIVDPDFINSIIQDYESYDEFPQTGKPGVIYIDKAENTVYRWDVPEQNYRLLGISPESIRFINASF